MAGSGRRDADSILISALAVGRSKRDAAATANVSERTLYRRLQSPDFVRQVDAARAELLDETLGRLHRASGDAADTLATLLYSESDTVKLQASRTILTLLLAVREQTTLSAEVQGLRELLEGAEAIR